MSSSSSSVELTFLSRFDVFIFCHQLKLSLHLELFSSSSFRIWNCLYIANWLSCFFSWTYLYVSNWCLHLLSSAEVILESRIDVLLFYHLLNLPFCLVLMSSLPVFNWTCLCISNCCLRLLSASENTFVSGTGVIFFLILLNLPLHLELMSSCSVFSWTSPLYLQLMTSSSSYIRIYLCISN